jgi:outer membrane protein OmpA-like peptidoglycan-associated protein
MKRMYKHIIYIGLIIFIFSTSISLTAQVVSQTNSKKLLLRDSLDFKNKKLEFNTNNAEFSPIPYKGGLLYISNKKIGNQHRVFNKVYWVPDSSMGKIVNDSINTLAKQFKFNDDFTPPTSNDNDILFNYHKIKIAKTTNPIENEFLTFSTEQSFAFNDSTRMLVYATLSHKKYGGKNRWQLWQAYLNNRNVTNRRLIHFDSLNADYLYPVLSEDGQKLYFSSNRIGGNGGFDIYYLNRKGDQWEKIPTAVHNVNSAFDELVSSVIKDTIFFSSNKTGGLGGFDVYSATLNTDETPTNLGYPINNEGDDIGFKKAGNNYYLSSNKKGSFDIAGIEYLPITYPVNGILQYLVDGTIIPKNTIFIKDADDNKIIDTLVSDNNGRFTFVGKPNRNYELTTTNSDGINITIPLQTTLNKRDEKQIANFAIQLKGRSAKQIQDSIHTAWVIAEQRKSDSIATSSYGSKFIVRYGFDKYNLKPKEKLVLDSLLNKLNRMPKSFIVVGAFTDCIGSYKYNYQLSVKRAKQVVTYLIQKGLDKNRIVSNGYSKKYTLSPCLVKPKKGQQSDSRRAEIVLSETKNTNWAALELARGKDYYAVYNSNNASKPTELLAKQPIVIKKNTITKAIVKANPKPTTPTFKAPVLVKKDTVAKVIAKVKAPTPVVVKKDTVAKVIAKVAAPTPIVVKKDTAAKVIAKITAPTPVVVKKDTVAKVIAKVTLPTILVKKDTIVKQISKASIPSLIVVKKDTVSKVIAKVTSPITKPIVIKKDSALSAQVSSAIKRDVVAKGPNPGINNTKTIIATSSDFDVEMSKAEILKALDSLASLKREQERIVEYLTKRINKKPIDIYVSSDSVTIEIYDNGIHDNDSVSVIYNNRIVVDRQELKVTKPIKFKLKVDVNKKYNELVMVAENLGSEPPNTAVMFVTEKSGRRQQVLLNTDMTHNEVVYFIRIGKDVPAK